MTEQPANEPVLGYAPGSAERAALRAEIERQAGSALEIKLRIGADSSSGVGACAIHAPHRHTLELGSYALAGSADVARAISAALEARSGWSERDFSGRAGIFLRAADLLSGPLRQRLNAATLLGQSKTPHQAEIDAACELSDFLRFNVHFASRLYDEGLISPRTERNHFDLRPLEGFVYAVTPFNFTAIAGNLPSVAALLGNVVVWKPSPYAMLSAHHIYELLLEAGLPAGVINLVSGDAAQISSQVFAHPEFGGLNFTGSSAVFDALSAQVASNLSRYRNYPRMVGETGGKNFILAHSSAELDALVVAIVRGGFEYQGQKCSAASRVYVPRSLMPALKGRLIDAMTTIKVGDPADFSRFMGAVIARHAFERLSAAIARAQASPACELIYGGNVDDSEGFFVGPTLFEVKEKQHFLLSEELFGPIVALKVYDDDRFDDVLEECDTANRYGLTGAVFARDRSAIAAASNRLRYSAGNLYVNDKPTGAVVAQQPFGGARRSGTNDKAGSMFYLLRWLSPRVIKENLEPPRDFRYPYMADEPESGAAQGVQRES